MSIYIPLIKSQFCLGNKLNLSTLVTLGINSNLSHGPISLVYKIRIKKNIIIHGDLPNIIPNRNVNSIVRSRNKLNSK